MSDNASPVFADTTFNRTLNHRVHGVSLVAPHTARDIGDLVLESNLQRRTDVGFRRDDSLARQQKRCQAVLWEKKDGPVHLIALYRNRVPYRLRQHRHLILIE